MVFPIYNEDGTSFHGLVLRKSTFDSVVMSLNQKISGDVFYTSNSLNVTMREYIVYNGVKYTLVNPPTITRNGLVSDNSDLKGMTKYSFEFYHPMCQLSNMPFNDVAVSFDEKRYLSEDKTFAWIGYPADFRDKLNKNLENTQWICELSESITQDKLNELSSVISFDKNTIADALKAWYDTWKLPFVIDEISEGESGWSLGKSFKIILGYPSNEIYSFHRGHSTGIPYVFRMGKGVGLKNNSRTPRNNKIVTRIAGYGSEDNIPYGYPQIVWTGNQSWDYTINNSSTIPNSYPIYDGIVNGRYVRLIKHPFTRTHLMPTVYTDSVDKKVNPLNNEYNPDIELIDYYDADNDDYENRINLYAPSYEIHEFEGLKPELGEAELLDAWPIDTEDAKTDIVMYDTFMQGLRDKALRTTIDIERQLLNELYNQIQAGNDWTVTGEGGGQYRYDIVLSHDSQYFYVSYDSNNICFNATVQRNESLIPEWIDDVDGDGNYKQSYFKVKLPILSFDIYACAAITQNMQINMRGGACLGCTFDVQVDWDAYKTSFYDTDGKFDPDGERRDKTMFPDSREEEIVVILKKENETFGTIMPNRYQNVKGGDAFVILGISLPLSYIRDAEERLDEEMKSYMLLNNIYYFDYPLKFDEAFLSNNIEILKQVRTNSTVRFMFAGVELSLFVKQITVKFGDSPLPQYDITLTDNIEVSTSPLGQVSDAVDRMAALIAQTRHGSGSGAGSGSGSGAGSGSGGDASEKLSRLYDDEAHGLIGFIKGAWFGTRQWFIDRFGDAVLKTVTARDEVLSDRFVTSNYTNDSMFGTGGLFQYLNGKAKLVTDIIVCRGKFVVNEIEDRIWTYAGGNLIFSAAGSTIFYVEYLDENDEALGYTFMNSPWLLNNVPLLAGMIAWSKRKKIQRDLTPEEKARVVKFRCYETSDDGTMQTRNWWHLDDIAMCQTLNRVKDKTVTSGGYSGALSNTVYLRRVIGIGSKRIDSIDIDRKIYDYVDLSLTDCDPDYNDWPAAGDVLVQRGNKTDSERQGFSTLEVTGQQRGLHVYDNVNDYTMEGKGKAFLGYNSDTERGELEVFGDCYIGAYGDPRPHEGSTYIRYDSQRKLLQIKAEIDVSSTFDGKNVSEYFNSLIHEITDAIQTQVDQKAETWYQSADPSLQWTTPEEKREHVGDLWHNTDNNKTYYYSASGWQEEPIPDDVFDTIDGKASVYINQPTSYKAKDLWILSAQTTLNGVTYKKGELLTASSDSNTFVASHWSKKVIYTDDDAFLTWKAQSYANDLTNVSNRITNAQNAADGAASAASTAQSAANAAQNTANTANQKATSAKDAADALAYVKDALKEHTTISGGLVLATLIGLRKGSTTWAGINGAYQSGDTIAAWFGGGMDNNAPIVFRMNGSGHVANKNISWTKEGKITIYTPGIKIYKSDGVFANISIDEDGDVFFDSKLLVQGKTMLYGQYTEIHGYGDSSHPGRTDIGSDTVNINYVDSQSAGTTNIGGTISVKGAATFTSTTTFSSSVTFNGSETHNGAETHNGINEFDGGIALDNNILHTGSGTVSLSTLCPSPRRGQILITKPTDGHDLTITGTILRHSGSGTVSSVGPDQRSRIFVYSGSNTKYWMEFSCYDT